MPGTELPLRMLINTTEVCPGFGPHPVPQIWEVKAALVDLEWPISLQLEFSCHWTHPSPRSIPTACPCWRELWEWARGSAGVQLPVQGVQGSCQVLKGNWTTLGPPGCAPFPVCLQQGVATGLLCEDTLVLETRGQFWGALCPLAPGDCVMCTLPLLLCLPTGNHPAA